MSALIRVRMQVHCDGVQKGNMPQRFDHQESKVVNYGLHAAVPDRRARPSRTTRLTKRGFPLSVSKKCFIALNVPPGSPLS